MKFKNRFAFHFLISLFVFPSILTQITNININYQDIPNLPLHRKLKMTLHKAQTIYPLSTISNQRNIVVNIPKNLLFIDGRLDSNWSAPIAEDNLGDGGSSAKGLQYLYLSTDNKFPYIGFSIDNQKLWTLGL